MSIKKVKIYNFKSLREFETELNPGLNILVGDNEAGKSTILEAIHLALTGVYCGRGIRNEISPYLINIDAIQEYLASLNSDAPIAPPCLMIEIYFNGSIDPNFEGNDNTDKQDKVEGFRFEIAFAEQHKDEYEKLVKSKDIKSLPTEYYVATWTNFGRTTVTTRIIPMKSVLIDSSNYRYQNGSDVYISRIVTQTSHNPTAQKTRCIKGYVGNDSITPQTTGSETPQEAWKERFSSALQSVHRWHEKAPEYCPASPQGSTAWSGRR